MQRAGRTGADKNLNSGPRARQQPPPGPTKRPKTRKPRRYRRNGSGSGPDFPARATPSRTNAGAAAQHTTGSHNQFFVYTPPRYRPGAAQGRPPRRKQQVFVGFVGGHAGTVVGQSSFAAAVEARRFHN